MLLRTLSVAAAAGRALAGRLEAIGQNLAHAETPGYKRIRTRFADFLEEALQRGRLAGAGGVVQERVFDPGALRRTGRDLDLAIEGEGFLKVLLPDGSEAYTRGGSFRIHEGGVLTTAEGYPLEPPVVVPEGIERVVIETSGRVLGIDPATGEAGEEIGQLGITRFPNPAGLRELDGRLYQATPSSGAGLVGRPGDEGGFGWIRQGFLEASNVDVSQELADLRATQRAFEINAKVIEAVDEVLRVVNDLRRDRV